MSLVYRMDTGTWYDDGQTELDDLESWLNQCLPRLNINKAKETAEQVLSAYKEPEFAEQVQRIRELF